MVNGVGFFVEATRVVLADKTIQRSLLLLIGAIICLFLVAHLVTFLVLLPFQITFTIFEILLSFFGVAFPPSLLSLLSLAPATWHETPLDHETSLSVALRSFVSSFVLSLPFVFLLILRYWWWQPLDDLFKRGLGLWDVKLAEDLYSLPPRGLWDSAVDCGKRMGKRLLFSLLLVLLSLLPGVGQFVFPLAQFYLAYKAFGLRLGLVLFAANLLPFVNPYSRAVYDHLYNCQSLARELLEPVFTRVRPSPGERGALIKRYTPLFYGFFTPFALCLPVAVLGPISFVVAQAAIAIILVKKMEKNSDLTFLENSSKSP